MAKDNRQKKRLKAAKKAARQAKRQGRTAAAPARPTQVPLSSARTAAASSSATSRPATATRRKKKSGAPVGKIVLVVLFLLFLAALIWFGITAVKFVKTYLSGDSGNGTETVVTAKENDNVAYYLLGMLGKEKDNGTTGRMQMVSVVCYDKKAKTVNVMQVPTTTYLGDTEHFAVKTVGGVWSNPKKLDWCETCRKQVFDAEITDGKHNVTLDNGKVCNTKITQKTGSAVGNLLDVFTLQYTLPIDNYYILPQEAFVKLVDLVGGVDIKLGNAMTLGGITYDAGIRTVDGEGALEYALGDWESANGELKNLTRQRQVYVALFERLMTTEKDKLDEDVLYPLMKGSTPIRTKRENEIADDIDLMIKLVGDLNKLDRANITISILPGETATLDGTLFYSVHKDELCALINDSFNPYGTPLTTEYLKMTEIAHTEKSDLKTATFDKLLIKQTGVIEEEEDDE